MEERSYEQGAMAHPPEGTGQPPESITEAAGHPYRRIREAIASFEWLEPLANSVQGAVGRVMEFVGWRVTDFLHGTWLRHPLHVALTDVPIGAWTAATSMDLFELGTNDTQLAKGADAAVALGIVAAVPTALSGLADWRHTYGYPRRVGLIHASLNATGLLLQIGSLVMRRSGRRRAGIALSGLGFLSLLGGAWLGGELVEEQAIGVDHTAFPTGPKRFVPVMADADLPEGRLQRVDAKGVHVLLYRRDGAIYAIGETCSHQGGPLSEGRIEDGKVVCPWHGSQFRLTDGNLVHGPSTYNQPRYDVRVVEGMIEVRQMPLGSE